MSKGMGGARADCCDAASGAYREDDQRAKDWSVQWIPKLEQDMQAGAAAVGILVISDYLRSPQFAQKVQAVCETFKKMREELESESW
jgi:hypothetical protein